MEDAGEPMIGARSSLIHKGAHSKSLRVKRRSRELAGLCNRMHLPPPRLPTVPIFPLP